MDSLDTLTTIAPADETQRARLQARDALDMTAKADALEAALQDAHAAWSTLVTQICRLAPVVDEPYGAMEQWLDSDREGIRQGIEGFPFGLTTLARKAGCCLAETEGEGF